MPVSEAKKKANMKYAKLHQKRVPLDMKISDYEILKTAAERSNKAVNTFIKEAIKEKIQNEAGK